MSELCMHVLTEHTQTRVWLPEHVTLKQAKICTVDAAYTKWIFVWCTLGIPEIHFSHEGGKSWGVSTHLATALACSYRSGRVLPHHCAQTQRAWWHWLVPTTVLTPCLLFLLVHRGHLGQIPDHIHRRHVLQIHPHGLYRRGHPDRNLHQAHCTLHLLHSSVDFRLHILRDSWDHQSTEH